MSQQANKPTSRRLTVEVRREAGSKALVFIDGEPKPLLWAFGLEGATELSDYKASGLNTVWVDVRWRANQDWGQLDEFLDLVNRQGLYLIIGIDAVPPPMLRNGSAKDQRRQMAVSVYDDAYVEWAREWIGEVVTHFRRRPNLIGWGTSHHPDAAASYDDAGFATFLSRFYESPRALSEAWGVPVSDFSMVTLRAAAQVDDQMTPLKYARPSLDAALFRWSSLRRLMDFWAQTIKQADPHHLLFTGKLSSYRSIISVPSSYDVIVPFVSPAQAEQDLASHNVHQVDMARRANEFVAIPVISTGKNVVGNDDYAVPVLGRGRVAATYRFRVGVSELSMWVKEAALHGAGGIAFSDWESLSRDETMQGFLKTTLDEVKEAGLFEATPLPTTALLYFPFGESATPYEPPLYGFATQEVYPEVYPTRLSFNEPGKLFHALRLGTRYGQVDYLSVESLLSANLSQYSCILAPLTLHLPEAAQSALAGYVQDGGVLMADIGVGAVQTDGSFRFLPPLLSRLFGIATVPVLLAGENFSVNMTILSRQPLFPSLREKDTLGRAGGAFGTILGMARQTTALPWGLLMRGTVGKRRNVRIESASVFLNRFGDGYAVFVPTLFWNRFLPGAQGFDEFHGDLMRRRALFEVTSAQGLGLDDVHAALFDRGIAIFNPFEGIRTVTIDILPDDGRLFAHAIMQMSLSARSKEPIHLFMDVKPQELLTLWRVPIWIDSASSGQAIVRVEEYQSEKVALRLYGADAQVVTVPGRLQVKAKKPQALRLVVADGLYPIAPGSVHRLTVKGRQNSDGGETQTLTADRWGRLVIAGEFVDEQVIIERVPSGE